jgi:sulfur transfer protein SufE
LQLETRSLSAPSTPLGTIPNPIPNHTKLDKEKMKTIQEQETQAILAMGEKIKQLQEQLNQANERVRQLESQVYGGSTQ